jgi:hypothetical protein
MVPGSIFTTLNFFVTYKLVQYDRVSHNTKLERFARNKDSGLLDLFVSYEENDVL